ncbi:hypothetical protein AV650_08245 [Serratia fonticola]|nr:hypothetical protein AV650_08245 [Serratia fonticola]
MVGLVICGCYSSMPVFAETPVIPGNIPADFKELWQPQFAMVEVKLYGRSLGVFKLSVLPDTVSFSEPEKVLEKLHVPDDKRPALLSLLSSPLARNGNLSCQGQSDTPTQCDFVPTDTAAVIMDDSDSVLNLFLGKAYLPDLNENSLFWQPTEDSRNALLHSQTLNYADSDGYRTLSLTGLGALGITKDSYTILDWRFNYQQAKNDDDDSSSSQHDSQVNSLYYRYDIAQRYYTQAGQMDGTDLSRADGGNFSFSLLPVPTILGGRIGTTQSYFRQRDTAVSSPVTVLLTRFSRVEAYRGNQLLGSFYMGAGVQSLNTQTFPEGNYPVELRIFEQDREVRREAVPFNKSTATMGEMQWDAFLQAGKLKNNGYYGTTEETKVPSNAIQTAMRIPLFSQATFQQGVSALDSKKYYEAKMDWSHGLWDGSLTTSFAYLWGADNAKGNNQNITYADGFSLSLYHNQQQVGDCTNNSDLSWGGCTESYSAALSKSLHSWMTTVGYTDNNNKTRYRNDVFINTAPSAFDYTPSWQQHEGRSRTWQVNVNTSTLWKDVSITPTIGVYRSQTQDQDNDYGVFLTLSLSRNEVTAAQRSRTLSAGYAYRNTRQNSPQQDMYVDGQWNFESDTAHRELETRLSGGDSDYTAMVRGRNNGRFGDLDASASRSYNRSENSNFSSLAATYSSSFALSREGLFWGGNASGIDRLAGSTVKVDSEETHAPLVALRGGSSINLQTLTGGERTLVPVSAMSRAQVTADEITTGKVNVQMLNTGSSDLFMLPGHVYPKTISAEISWTYIGRILDEQGQPLAGATVLNTPALKTESDGGFSFDYSHKDPIIYFLHHRQIYACPVTVAPREDALIYLGEVHCKIIAADALPRQLTQQSRVSALLAQR